MDKYLGWTDLFFIGVPEELTEEAIRKAEEVSLQVFGGDPKYGMDSGVDLNKYMVGVFNIDNGQIYKMPARKQSVSMENRLKIQEQVIYNVLFDEMKSITVKLEEMSIETIPFNNLPARSPSGAAETPSDSPKPSRAANTPPNGQSAATSPEKPTSVRPTLDEGFVAARMRAPLDVPVAASSSIS